MGSLDKLWSQIRRADKAAAELDGAVGEAFAQVEEELMKGWLEARPEDEDLLSTLKMNQAALNQVKAKMKYYLAQGKAAKKEIEENNE